MKKITFTQKQTSASTVYVDISKDDHDTVLGYMFAWNAFGAEFHNDPKADIEFFYKDQPKLPRMTKGRMNSIASYIGGILNNQLFRANKNGNYQRDFTLENIAHIQRISEIMHDLCDTEVLQFEESMWNS